MKKHFNIFLVIASFLISSTALAQEENKLSIGVQVAPSRTFWYNNTSDVYTSKLGFVAGIATQYNIKPWLALCFDLNYERKGRDIDFSNLTFSDGVDSRRGFDYDKHVSVSASLDYITLPVMVKFKLGEKIKCFTNIGIYAGYLARTGEYDSPANYNNRFDIGLINSLGLEVPIKKRAQLSIEARNNLGFVPVFYGSKNESLALLIGFAYKISGKKSQ
jgi:hypothetical protein